MWMMLQHEEPDDYVLATNRGFTVKEFIQISFQTVGLKWEKCVKFGRRYLRPTEIDALIGDYSKAKAILGWTPVTLAPNLARIVVNKPLQS